jgi:exodeoxyribonuclease VIII
MSRLPGIYPHISNTQYHADNEWMSSSQLKVALQGAFHFKYFVLDKQGSYTASKSKDFGSATHKLTLEPEDFFNEYAVLSETLDMRRTADKARYETFAQQNPGKIVLTRDQFAEIEKCRDSVYQHPDAKALLELGGKAEVSCYAEIDHQLPTGEVVPFKVRVRPDLLGPTAILDLKTSKNPAKDSFCRDAFGPWGYHYDLSAALYQKVIAKLTGEILPFIFLVVKNDQPYETAVYKMSDESMAMGNKKLSRAMDVILMAKKEDKWVYQETMETI